MLKQIVCKWTLFWINIFQCVLFYFWAFFLQVSYENGHRCCFKQTLYALKSWNFYRNLHKGSISSLWKWMSSNGKIYNLHTFLQKGMSIFSADKTWSTDYSFPLMWCFTCKFIALSILQFDTNLSTVTTVNYIFSCKVIILRPGW